MHMRKTPKQAHCEKETSSWGKACDILVDTQNTANSTTHSWTHIFFFPFLTKYYQVLHYNLARFGRHGRCGKTRVHSFPSRTLERGQRSLEENIAADTEEGSQNNCVLSLSDNYQLPPSCISHIATFSAKQKSPRCKWHTSIIWRRGWLKDEVFIIS